MRRSGNFVVDMKKRSSIKSRSTRGFKYISMRYWRSLYLQEGQLTCFSILCSVFYTAKIDCLLFVCSRESWLRTTSRGGSIGLSHPSNRGVLPLWMEPYFLTMASYISGLSPGKVEDFLGRVKMKMQD